jgi:hypothetical protein
MRDEGRKNKEKIQKALVKIEEEKEEGKSED